MIDNSNDNKVIEWIIENNADFLADLFRRVAKESALSLES